MLYVGVETLLNARFCPVGDPGCAWWDRTCSSTSIRIGCSGDPLSHNGNSGGKSTANNGVARDNIAVNAARKIGDVLIVLTLYLIRCNFILCTFRLYFSIDQIVLRHMGSTTTPPAKPSCIRETRVLHCSLAFISLARKVETPKWSAHQWR